GEAPDIIMLQSYSNVFEYAKGGYLLDITNNPILNNIVEQTKKSVTFNNKIYALPLDLAAIGIVYNKNIFSKLNLKPPVTFLELQNVCKVLNQNKIIPFSASIKDEWPLGHFFSMAHTTIHDHDLFEWIESMNKGLGSFDNHNMREIFKVFDFYLLNSGPDSLEMDYSNQILNFSSDKYAMMVQGLWAYGAAKQINPNLNAGLFPFPFTNKPDETKLYVDTDSCLAVSSKSKHKKEALCFLEFLTTEEGIKLIVEKCKLVPAIKGADVSSMDKPFQNFLEYVQLKQTMPWGFAMWPVSVFESSKKEMQKYYYKQKTAKNVIESLDNLWQESNKSDH
ncbi:MAG: extracellular solute-binding protein, partial [Spirochaetes bacterium]|nr:extracellular solute-binding protein [Spirochaetota bacterium]